MKALIIYQKDYPEYFSKLSEVIGEQKTNYSLAAVINPDRQEIVVCKTKRGEEQWKEVGVYKCVISIFKSKTRRNLYITTDFNSMKILHTTLKIEEKQEVKPQSSKIDNELLFDLNFGLDLLLFASRNK